MKDRLISKEAKFRLQTKLCTLQSGVLEECELGEFDQIKNNCG